MILFKENKKNIQGFTLIEIMVSVAIFAIVVLIAMGSLVAIVGADKKAQSLNDVINNMNFSVESMVRDLRTGYSYQQSCPSGAGDSQVGGNACTSLQFTSTISGQADDIVTYYLSGTAIYKSETVNGTTEVAPLTSADIDVTRLDFYIVNNTAPTQTQPEQPLVLMILQAQSSAGGGEVSQFNIQTLISQRKLNIQ